MSPSWIVVNAYQSIEQEQSHYTPILILKQVKMCPSSSVGPALLNWKWTKWLLSATINFKDLFENASTFCFQILINISCLTSFKMYFLWLCFCCGSSLIYPETEKKNPGNMHQPRTKIHHVLNTFVKLNHKFSIMVILLECSSALFSHWFYSFHEVLEVLQNRMLNFNVLALVIDHWW